MSDGLSMGDEGVHHLLASREVIADSFEIVMQAEPLDAPVALAGRGQFIRGTLMAAGRPSPRRSQPCLSFSSPIPGRLPRPENPDEALPLRQRLRLLECRPRDWPTVSKTSGQADPVQESGVFRYPRLIPTASCAPRQQTP